MTLIVTLLFWFSLESIILISSLISYFLPDKLFYCWVRFVIKELFKVFFIRVSMDSVVQIPDEQRLVFIANKPNMISTFALIAFFPKTIRIVADKKLFRFPFLGRIVKKLGCISSVSKKEETFGFAAKLSSCVKKGEAILFYPHNLRQWDGQVGVFKPEEFNIARMLKATVVTLAVLGADQVNPAETMIIRPGQLIIKIDAAYNNVTDEQRGALQARYRKLLKKEDK